MVTVMRQRSWHKPNGARAAYEKAKGCFSGPVRLAIPKPYKAKGPHRTKSMREIYAELPRKEHIPDKKRRKLRRRLANMKMPIPVAYHP